MWDLKTTLGEGEAALASHGPAQVGAEPLPWENVLGLEGWGDTHGRLALHWAPDGGQGKDWPRDLDLTLCPPCCVTLDESFNLSETQRRQGGHTHLSGLSCGLEIKGMKRGAETQRV